MKHRKTHGDRYYQDDDCLPEIELDETSYAGLSQVRAPSRKRWLADHDHSWRSRDNEGWDSDRIIELRRARKARGRNRRDRKRFYDEEDE
jgi:hypothetical protein